MRDLMLELLCYEPFEKITGDEKKYIDAVLRGDENIASSYHLYDELMQSFESFDIDRANKDSLINWFNFNYYIAEGHVMSRHTDTRTYYPVLFKKIVFYCLTKYNLSDKEFLADFGIKPNILNKWACCPRYRKLINRDTMVSLKIHRNGKKQSYLTKVIKAAYYRASEIAAFEQYYDPSIKGYFAPKKDRLLPFFDCFAGTGMVSASVDANDIRINDIDVGVVCFLYSVSHLIKKFKTSLVQLHEGFISKDYDSNPKFTVQDWIRDYKYKYSKYSSGGADYDAFVVRLRNNMNYIHEIYMGLIKNSYKLNSITSVSPSDEDTIVNIGVSWFFLNSIKMNNSGNAFDMHSIDCYSYYAYIKNKLGVPCTNVKNSDEVDAYQVIMGLKFSSRTLFTTDNSKVDNRIVKNAESYKAYFKAIKNCSISDYDFAHATSINTDSFVYYDSPYFLLTDYNIPFQDAQHKDMLDMLRDADFYWLFSMQYLEPSISEPRKGIKKRIEKLQAGDQLIKSYWDYYGGFANEFTVEQDEKGYNYYVSHPEVLNESASKLFVIMFYPIDDTHNPELMICNFDVRKVLPHLFSDVGEGVREYAVVPYTAFMSIISDAQHSTDKFDVFWRCIKYREQYIIDNYASGNYV